MLARDLHQKYERMFFHIQNHKETSFQLTNDGKSLQTIKNKSCFSSLFFQTIPPLSSGGHK